MILNQGGYRIKDQKAIHFLTFTTIYWIDVFTRPAYKQMLIDALKFYQKERGLIVYAFVIMTNHIHIIMRSTKVPLSDIIRDYKRWTSNKMIEAIKKNTESRSKWLLDLMGQAGAKNHRNTHFQMWTNDNHPMEIFSHKFYDQKRNYIHQNPVKAGIVYRPEDYVYSSASNYAGLGGVIEVCFLNDTNW